MIGSGMLDMRRLETLLAVASSGSFAGAADALCFTPSAVSQQMSALERATGVVLFERGARGVELTIAGQALREHAEAVVDRVVEAESELQALGGLAENRMRFGSFSSATGAFAGEAFQRFAELYPDAETSFVDGEPFEVLALLGQNELDLAVIFEVDGWPLRDDYRGISACAELRLDCVSLFDDPYLLVLPDDHPLAAEPVMRLTDLDDKPILVAPPWHPHLERVCRAAGVEPRFDASCRGIGFEALQTLVFAQRGLTLMPRLALGWLRDGLTARPLEAAPVRHVRAATLARAHRTAASRAMLEILAATSHVHACVDQTEAVHSRREFSAALTS